MASSLNRFEIWFAWLESHHPGPIKRACAAKLSLFIGDHSVETGPTASAPQKVSKNPKIR